MEEYTAEVLCLGNELLIGRTVNKNATDIALRLTKLGYKVTRATTIRDELESAITCLQEIIDRKPDVICISGGLGPTFDDIQLQVVAKTLNLQIELNEEALEMIRSKYEQLNEYRRKMALLPQGSKPLANKVGSAPGVLTMKDDIPIFSMPGVPREMRDIMDNQVLPYLEQYHHFSQHLVEFGADIRGARESDISGITDEVREKYPEVNFKSHPRKDKQGYFLSLHTYQITNDSESVKSALINWIEEIETKFEISKTGIKPVMDKS